MDPKCIYFSESSLQALQIIFQFASDLLERTLKCVVGRNLTLKCVAPHDVSSSHVITPQRCDLSHLCEVSHDIVVDHNVVVCRHNLVCILCYRTHYHNVVLIHHFHHNVAIKS